MKGINNGKIWVKKLQVHKCGKLASHTYIFNLPSKTLCCTSKIAWAERLLLYLDEISNEPRELLKSEKATTDYRGRRMHRYQQRDLWIAAYFLSSRMYNWAIVSRFYTPKPESIFNMRIATIRGRAPKAQGRGSNFFFSRGGLIFQKYRKRGHLLL